jgi:hypothetical protein
MQTKTKAQRARRRTIRDGIWHPGLMCHLLHLEYDCRRGIGKLYFPSGNCCDCAGAIKLFENIDPDVQRIETWSGNDPDTVYDRSAGKWDVYLRSR